jgi:hypothetical protein
MLIVEDGTGLTNADSLASVAFADNYHFLRANERWQEISPTRKEQLLRRATDYIKYIFGRSLAGVVAVTGQSQVFPRIISGVNVGNPLAVQEATAELALIADTTALMPSETSMRKKMVKVGPIQVEYDASSFTGPRFVSAVNRLIEFMDGRSSGMTARLVRT